MRFIEADVIFTGEGSTLNDHVIAVDEHHSITGIIPKKEVGDANKIEYHQGALTPGFINTHCHLELSHMKGLVDTGTTLLPFLKAVVQFRDFPQEVIDQAIIAADNEMARNGIVACGDISNKGDTAKTKATSSIQYYTFVEMFDFMQPFLTEKTIDQYRQVYEFQTESGSPHNSYVPHAPYTVSPELFKFINDNNKSMSTVSIHNQETQEENALFQSGTGGFVDFFNGFGFDMSSFKPIKKTSIHYAMLHMDPAQKTLFVHNTQTDIEDLKAAQQWSDNTYWATCPNANLYIENNLPNYQVFIDQDAKVTIGTDSLTSNWQLNIASEMLAIQKYCSYVPLAKVIQWATLNGAEALGFERDLGSITIGKSPGLNIIDASIVNDKWVLQSDTVKKIL